MGENWYFHLWGPKKYFNFLLAQLSPQIVENWDGELVDFIFSHEEAYFSKMFSIYSLSYESKIFEIWYFECGWSRPEGPVEPPSGGVEPATMQWMPIATVAMATQTWCI